MNCFSLIQFLWHFVTLDIFASQSRIPTAVPLKTVATSQMLKRYKIKISPLQLCTLNLVNQRTDDKKRTGRKPK